jgi:hypothetical protein
MFIETTIEKKIKEHINDKELININEIVINVLFILF